MIRNLKITGILCLLTLPLFIKAQVIQPSSDQTDSIINLAAQSTSDNNGFYDKYFNNIVPNSPTVGELMKYIDQPVDLFHGLPTIEIPIYTIECGEITFPITLSYHAGGIKVDQIATWVGLGWSLNVGGACTVNCLDDKFGNFESRPFNIMTMKEMESYMENVGFTNKNQGVMLEELLNRQTIPNICSYNFMGHSGRFFIYSSNAYQLSGNQQLEFKNLFPNSRFHFSAQDLKGYKYEFGEGARTEAYGMQHPCQYITDHCWEYISPTSLSIMGKRKGTQSYNLTKVVGSSGNDSICLSYKKQIATYKNMATGIMSKMLNINNLGDYIIKRGERSYSACNNQIIAMESNVNEIVASNGIRIVFVVDEKRNDLRRENLTMGIKALSGIKIYEPSGDLLKQWVFEYDYFKSYIDHPTDTCSNLRLKLKSVKEYGNSSIAAPRVYSFSYYGEEPNEPQMPFRTSFGGRDYWGYCNSVTNIPEATSFYRSFPSKEDQYNPVNVGTGRDLGANESYCNAYSLKSINYPTGGKRVFRYQVNVASMFQNFGGLRIHKIINYSSPNDSTVKEYEYTNCYVTDPPVFSRLRRRDKSANPDKFNLQSEEICDVSSTPFANLASFTDGSVNYAGVKEISEDAIVLYNYSGAYYMPRYSGYRVLVEHDMNNDWAPYHTDYSDYYNERHPDFNFNYICPDYKHGQLLQKKIITNDGFVINEVYEYDYQECDTVPIMQISYGTKEWRNEYAYYDIMVSDYITGKASLKMKTTYSYKNLDDYTDPAIVQKQMEQSYTYNKYDLPQSVTTIFNHGDTLVNETRYVSDILASPYREMVEERKINYPVEVTKKVNNKVVESELLTYAKKEGHFLRENVYELKPSVPLASFDSFNGNPSSIYGEPVGTVSAFTSCGKIAALCGRDQMNVVYLWGYNNQYLIAEIRNATYGEVTTKIPKSAIEAIATRLEPTSADWSQIDGLRIMLPQAHVTVLTYKPAIGISSICGPDERSVYFDYDAFGQLKETYRMENGLKKVIENYEYHYPEN